MANEKEKFIKRKMVSMPLKKLISEHENLLNVLRTGNGVKKEYAEQKKELNTYKKM